MKTQTDKTKIQIEMRYVCDLIPYIRNARTHSDEQIAQIAGSIREFGWTNPVLVDNESRIIAGHGRVMAAQKLGIEKIPTISLSGLSDIQRRAYVIADNKIALNAGWDDKQLAVEFAELMNKDFDIKKLGFTDEEMANILYVENDNVPPSSTKEINTDEYIMDCKCPECGFEFNAP